MSPMTSRRTESSDTLELPLPAVSRSGERQPRQQQRTEGRKRFYIPVKAKFCLSLCAGTLWAIFSIIVAKPWIIGLGKITGNFVAALIIYGIAIIPGFMNAFLVVSLLLDRRPRFQKDEESTLPAITILIAAYNEGKNIAETIKSIALQNYNGEFCVIVVNDGSTDGTKAVLSKMNYPWLHVLNLPRNIGKAKALNQGLKLVKTSLTLTVDGDSYLLRNALRNLVLRYLNDPKNTKAVAGAVLVRNSRANLVTKVQEWDYFHGISAVKRLQSLYHGTLVAQGAFSLYETSVLEKLNGWPHTVGEDIVLTWGILETGARVGFAENACLFTNAPDTWRQFIRQRQRWSRGMIEAFKMHWKLLFKWRMTTLFIWWNFFFPYMDMVYTLAFIPGIVIAFFGVYWIAGPFTLLVFPLGFGINYLQFWIQSRMFREQGLKVRKNVAGFVMYVLLYSMVLQPACVIGYIKEFMMHTKTWGTK